MKEIWKDIPGFEGWYQASNYGKIKSIVRQVNYKKHSDLLATRKEHLLSPKKSRKGYLEVILSKNAKLYYYRVHRLIAITFLKNPNNLPYINHIDENKNNNFVSNLEWCSHKQNMNAYYSTRTKFYQYDLSGKLLQKCNSFVTMAKEINGDKTGIQHCCKGTIKTYLGFIFTYNLLTPEELLERTTNNSKTKIIQLNLEGEEIARYNSIKEAANCVHCVSSAISLACAGKRKTIKGYVWKYEKPV